MQLHRLGSINCKNKNQVLETLVGFSVLSLCLSVVDRNKKSLLPHMNDTAHVGSGEN